MNTDTPIPRTDEWETYYDESYYELWRIRRKNERGFNDGFHVHDGEEAKQITEMLNERDALRNALEEITAACEKDYCSDDTETGESACADDECVAIPNVALTFGMIRRARKLLTP